MGLNLQVKTSPACPVSSMMGASRADVLAGPYMQIGTLHAWLCKTCSFLRFKLRQSTGVWGWFTSGFALLLCVRAPSSTRCLFTMAPSWPFASGE